MRTLVLILAAWVLLAGSLLDLSCHEAFSCPAALALDLSPLLTASLNPFFPDGLTGQPGPSARLDHPPQRDRG